jgi:ferritin heavy chain
LPGHAKYFKKAAHEELEHAQKFMEYQNKRGGRVVLKDLKKPAKDEWGTALDAMKAAQELERTVNKALLDLHATSDKHNDYQVTTVLLCGWKLVRKTFIPCLITYTCSRGDTLILFLSLQMSDFIEGEFLQEQVDAIKELGGYITQLERVGAGHGEYHFDKELDD